MTGVIFYRDGFQERNFDRKIETLQVSFSVNIAKHRPYQCEASHYKLQDVTLFQLTYLCRKIRGKHMLPAMYPYLKISITTSCALNKQ